MTTERLIRRRLIRSIIYMISGFIFLLVGVITLFLDNEVSYKVIQLIAFTIAGMIYIVVGYFFNKSAKAMKSEYERLKKLENKIYYKRV